MTRRLNYDETSLHPANRIVNLRRRVDRARNFPTNTCGASRHLHMIAEAMVAGKPYPMLQDEPEHCAASMLSVLESLWKLRTRMQKLDPNGEASRNAKALAKLNAAMKART